MGTIFAYSLTSALLLATMYLVFKWMLAGENQHRYNRAILWLIYTLSLTLPALIPALKHLTETTSHQTGIAGMEQAIEIGMPSASIAEAEPLLLPRILLAIYIAGAAAAAVYTVFVAIKLHATISKGEKMPHGRYTLAITPDTRIAPFSWCCYIVMSRSDFETSGEVITLHETRHLDARHWVDLLLAQLVAIFQWYNPAAWLMREELKTVHEFQADEAVIRSGTDPRQYQMLLIKKAVGARFPSLANSLNHSKLKKRITMMYNSKSSATRRLKGLALVPACAVALFVTDIPAVASLLSDTASAYILPEQENSTESVVADESAVVGYKNSENNFVDQSSTAVSAENGELDASVSKPADDDDVKVYDIAEVKPQYPGGEAEMLNYIMSQIRYPKDAFAANIQGRVILQFVVKKDGSVGDVKVVRGIDKSLDNEAVRVIKTLKKFTPAMIGGKPVSTWYTIPVAFKLSEPVSKPQAPAPAVEETGNAKPAPTVSDDDRVFEVVEQKPQFPGGEVMLMKYIANHINYPEAALKANKQGRVVVQFVVKKDGSVGDVKIVRGQDAELDKEAIRVVKSLPAFQPAMMGNEYVNVWYTLPVQFKLKKDEPSDKDTANSMKYIRVKGKSDTATGIDSMHRYMEEEEISRETLMAINSVDIQSIEVMKADRVIKVFMRDKDI